MPPKPLLSATLTESDLHKLRFPLLASPKIDGIRGLADHGKVYSRSGKLIPNRYIQKSFSLANLHGQDGELVIGPPNVPDTYKSTRGPVMSFDGEPQFTYYIFDYWDSPNFFSERYLYGTRSLMHSDHYPDFVKIVPQKLMTSVSAILAYESSTIADGYEGIMLRSPTAIYKQGRSTLREQTLCKLKRFVDDEAEIIGFEERMHNANENVGDAFGYAKRSSAAEGLIGCGDLGALIVRMLTGPFTEVECKVGTGFTADERRLIWRQRDIYLHQTCVVKWFPPGSDKAPRLPSWKGLRSDEE